MARTAVKTANTLSLMYDESFDGEVMEMFRLGWPELRSLAGVPKLTEEYLADINRTLAESHYALIPLDDYLVVAMQGDFSHARKIPSRLLEQYLPEEEDIHYVEEGDDELEDEDE